MPIAALIGGAISIGINWWNRESQKKADRIAARESANQALRDYQEMSRQRDVSTRLFDQSIEGAYGVDFLSKLRSGSDMSSLMASLAQGDTAISKQLQAYQADAKQAVDNSVRANQMEGMLASMQGGLNRIGTLGQAIQGEQAVGDTISSQSVSGIKANAGTGSNAQRMQEQANNLAMESINQQITMQNKGSLLQMESGQTTASQKADNLRRTADITAQEQAEAAMRQYESYKAEQEDLTASMKAYKDDYEYLMDKSEVKYASFADTIKTIMEESTKTDKRFKFEDD